MKKLNKILFSLVAPAVLPGQSLGGGAESGLDSETLAAVFAHAKRHDLGHLLAGAVRKMQNAERLSAELIAELERAELTAVWRVKNIENEQARVKKCLEEADVPFILLKGAVLRGYYPEAWQRTSSDIDVLVPKDKLSHAISVICDGLGYEVSTSEINDVSLYAKSGVHLDMHTLFEGDGEDGRLLDAAWREADTNGGCERFLTPEHFYLYHVAHMAEHMRNGGCGVRPFIDLYIINSRLSLDTEKVAALLRECGLDRFETAAKKLSAAWVEGLDVGELASFENYVLTGGVYGSVEQGVAAKRRDGKGKLGYVMRRIFMPYSELKQRHPALDGRPWLTPFFEVWRWCGLLVPARFKRTRAELKATAKLNTDKLTSVGELLDELGL